MNAAPNITTLRHSAFEGEYFTKEYHAFYRLWGHASFVALGVLDYLRRYSHGYPGHGDCVKTTVSEIARTFKVTRPTIVTALAELRALNVITDDGTPGSTKVRTFEIVDPKDWCIPDETLDERDDVETPPDSSDDDTTCQNILQVVPDVACQDSLQVAEPACQNPIQADVITCQNVLQVSSTKESREKKAGEKHAPARASRSTSKPNDLDRILETLHDAPGYRVDEKLEWRVLEALCPIGVGLSGDGCDTFEIAFVLEQATTFVAWRGRLDEIERESASAEKRKPQKPRCDAQTFKRFMQSDKAREDYRAWRNTRAVRAHQDRAETSTREHTAALASASSDYLAAKRQHDADLLADVRAARRARFTPTPKTSSTSTLSAKGARQS